MAIKVIPSLKKFCVRCLIVIVIVTSITCFSACSQSGFLNTSATEYRNKINSASEYSMRIKYNYNNFPSVFVDCYYKNEAFSYRYSTSITHDYLTYREIFIDQTHYRLLEAYLGLAGQYTEASPIEATSDSNFVYKYTKKLIDNSVYTMLKRAKKVELNGKKVTFFEISYEGIDYEFYYDENSLLVKFVMKEGGNTTTLTYSDYVFENVSTTYFTLPKDMPGFYFKSNNLLIDIFLQ